MKISNALLDPMDMGEASDDHLQALECLYSVIDPELGVNIVDLGLVYSLDIEGDVARVEMTMTTPACPLHTYMTTGVTDAIREAMPAIRDVEVDLTFKPPWNPDMMSGRAKYQLGW
ncbi:MAG TPA: metal-sulfur cluster assembly factor [Chloroflexia bacterium]|nr:metal-sulfur cluster assembly factor [Chloroflexia bacterium]